MNPTGSESTATGFTVGASMLVARQGDEHHRYLQVVGVNTPRVSHVPPIQQYSDKAGIVNGIDVLRWRRQARK